MNLFIHLSNWWATCWTDKLRARTFLSPQSCHLVTYEPVTFFTIQEQFGSYRSQLFTPSECRYMIAWYVFNNRISDRIDRNWYRTTCGWTTLSVWWHVPQTIEILRNIWRFQIKDTVTKFSSQIRPTGEIVIKLSNQSYVRQKASHKRFRTRIDQYAPRS